ncbi:MAG: AAA family ATPase [Cyanobacteria bacterium SBLK]|nr:AAA family ATPase [Cyanobacteria bacterium SBLK]
MKKLKHLKIKGFKSIESMDLELRPLNILIGSNGAGKSNLISFFKMLNEMMPGRLQQHIGISGSAQSLLHFGPKITTQIEGELTFEVENGLDTYIMRLAHAANDILIFTEETLKFLKTGYSSPKVDSLGVGHQETKINQSADNGLETAKTLKYLLDRCRVYHFHDTSSTAGVRQSCYIGDDRWLMPDAANLAAMLLKFRQSDGGFAYHRIIQAIQAIAPFFDDFVLEPNGYNRVILNWREKGSDRIFGPHQFSDGTLRAICLISLLLQPEEDLPKLIIVDEPELGLHPYALNEIAAIFGKVSYSTQVLISTQSSSFVDNFEPEDIIAVNRKEKVSTFERLDSLKLETWLEEYSLGEIWEKNIVGGGPH